MDHRNVAKSNLNYLSEKTVRLNQENENDSLEIFNLHTLHLCFQLTGLPYLEILIGASHILIMFQKQEEGDK